jgi:ribosomal protein L3 glutamine methyltransferase
LKGGLSKRRSRPAPRVTAADLIREGERRLSAARLQYGHGVLGPRDEAAYLVLYALKLPLDAPARTLSRLVNPGNAKRVRELLDLRIRSRKPAAYLTREAWLGRYRFYVDERVIVPRSHIATLLDERLAPWIARPDRIDAALDLCTGSGCLAVVLAHAFPHARIDAIDLSPAALAVARINVRQYKLGKQIRLARSDLYSALRGRRYGLIVCNPPYVTAPAMRRLPREYRHEPRMALAGGGRDGLDLVRAIFLGASRHLQPGGTLVMEVGEGRKRVERAFPRTEFTWIETPGGGDVLVVSREQLPP